MSDHSHNRLQGNTLIALQVQIDCNHKAIVYLVIVIMTNKKRKAKTRLLVNKNFNSELRNGYEIL